MKICSDCGVEFPLSNFYIQKTRKDGYDKRCKPCSKIHADKLKATRIKKKKKEKPIELTFKTGQELEVSYRNYDGRLNVIESFKGNVIFANDKHITVKGQYYPTSFTLQQFREGEVKVVR